jgi:hypothetical protein
LDEHQSELFPEQTVKREGKSQNEALRDYFLSRPKVAIPLPVLAKVITNTGLGAAVHSRVNDCRKKFGMNIRNILKRRNGNTVSLYAYEPNELSEA